MERITIGIVLRAHVNITVQVPDPDRQPVRNLQGAVEPITTGIQEPVAVRLIQLVLLHQVGVAAAIIGIVRHVVVNQVAKLHQAGAGLTTTGILELVCVNRQLLLAKPQHPAVELTTIGIQAPVRADSTKVAVAGVELLALPLRQVAAPIIIGIRELAAASHIPAVLPHQADADITIIGIIQPAAANTIRLLRLHHVPRLLMVAAQTIIGIVVLVRVNKAQERAPVLRLREDVAQTIIGILTLAPANLSIQLATLRPRAAAQTTTGILITVLADQVQPLLQIIVHHPGAAVDTTTIGINIPAPVNITRHPVFLRRMAAVPINIGIIIPVIAKITVQDRQLIVSSLLPVAVITTIGILPLVYVNKVPM
ncbi:hypothetical protein A2955_02085 [Candidatus Woesebacteria bacterium RIFCSPLOWO2_01_FULL_37_19]|uniref:Uncharacterized protein n=1 Tax=Candidatus Woesebacteria bacterium RIFCSPLOWO2_01_FULL_37_19 TaxID=1802514 RepID=A0A1F8B6S9_9BACT|nr:MAG: hypothetical protein A2955_02085 [Candidatus Woesebacteria bacterium RIFCSPLOWO2_01_FULL_37_19]